MKITEEMKKVGIFTVKGCYRSICKHPFIVGMLCFLVFLYRSYPSMFSFLVSASPVLACTAILLGTLLSFGKPNIPEIESEERTTHGIMSLKTEFSENNVVFDRDESVSVERYGDEGNAAVEQLVKETSSVANEICRDGSDGSFGESLEKRSKEIEFDDRVQEERHREFVDLGLESKTEMFEERLGDSRIVKNHYSLIPVIDDEQLDLENDRSPTGSVDSKVVNVDSLDSPPCTPWMHANQEDEEEDEDDEALDSGSDRAESSSPDASMADILPVLDELHPLLVEEAPYPVDLSPDGSDAASEQSFRSDESTNESDDDTEKQLSEVEEHDKEGEDGEETHQEEEDQTKSAITWTEEDERNLMDLGSSELERNQRLENLIARRRARKTMSVLPETKLIDLESTDLTFNVPPILTTRNNPFDISQDSYKDMGLPPIPGSAPSVLLHRKNPFDIPYDSSEEKPDLMEDSFQQEFTPSQSKEHFVRRHESFNTWRTPFGINRPEKKNTTRFRPYFVAEPLGLEGTSYSHFQRQSSGLSDSKASSVPDTGSISSSEVTEDWNVTEEGTFEIEDRNDDEDDITRELDFISRNEQPSKLAGHGSESSEEESAIEFGRVEERPMKNDETDMKLEGTGYHQEAESSLVEEQRLANQFEISLRETYLNVEGHEQRYRSISRSSSLSEESERIYVQKEAEEYPSFINEINQHEEPSISGQPSLRGSHLNITAPLGNDAFHRDPVYDLSPLDVKESVSRPSDGSDLAPVVIKKTVSFAERVTEIGNQEVESDSIVDKEMLFGSSEIIQVDESQMASSSDVRMTKCNDRRNETERIFGGHTEMTGHNDVNYEFSEDNKFSASAQASGVPETEIITGGHMETAEGVDVKYVFSETATISAGDRLSGVPETLLEHIAKSSSGSSLEETLMYEFDTYTDHIQSLCVPFCEPSLAGSIKKLDFAGAHCKQSVSMQTGEQNLVVSKESLESENDERGSCAPLNMLSSDSQSIIDHTTSDSQSIVDHTTQGESVLSEQGLFLSSFYPPDHEDKTPTPPIHQYPVTESSESLSVEEMALSQNSFYKPSPGDHKETLESEIASSRVHHDSESSLTDIGENRTQAHATDQVGYTEELGSTINDLDQYDEDMKHVSEFKIYRSPVDPIDPLQYDRIGLDDSGHLQSTEENTYSKAKEADIEVNSLQEIPDIEENDSVMAETEAHSANTIEEVIIKAELTPAKTGVMRLDPPPSFIDLPLEETSTAGKESIATGKIHDQAKIHMETQEFQDMDLNQPLENSGSVLSAECAQDIEGTFLKLLESERQSLNDSDLALKQESKTSIEALGFSEDGMAEDVQADFDFLKESDVQKTLRNSDEADMDEAKSPESDDMLISERKSLVESFSALKQESEGSPSEALKMSEDVRVDTYSPREAKSGAEVSNEKGTQQTFLEEPYSSEASTHKSHEILISERQSLDDSDLVLKQESSSLSKALKLFEDGLPDNVQADTDSRAETKSGVEESDVKETRQNSSEEPNFVEVKTPECHDVAVSDVENHIKETDKKSSSSSNSSSSDSDKE